MRFFILCLFLFVGCKLDLLHGQIIFPNLPNLAETLDVPTNINTRLGFPDTRDNCVTNNGENGKCLLLNSCPELLTFIHVRNGLATREGLRFIRNRICRFRGRNVELCCVNKTAPVVNPSDNTGIGKVQLPSESECGFTVIPRITNGKDFKHGAHPWLAGVGFPRDDGSFRVLCGGTVISKRHVITAAHCFIRQPGTRPLTHVRLGEYSLSKNNEKISPITLRILDRKSPGYDKISHINDLELLVLEKEFAFTTFVRPACLPFGLESRNFDNEKMIIAGWGHTFFRSGMGTDVPLAANISVVPKSICREDYRSEPQVPLDNTQLCAGKGDKDACQGDSGGPLLYQGTRFYLMGVVSFGVGCANENFPGVYTYIPEFMKWITDNV